MEMYQVQMIIFLRFKKTKTPDTFINHFIFKGIQQLQWCHKQNSKKHCLFSKIQQKYSLKIWSSSEKNMIQKKYRLHKPSKLLCLLVIRLVRYWFHWIFMTFKCNSFSSDPADKEAIDEAERHALQVIPEGSSLVSVHAVYLYCLIFCIFLWSKSNQREDRF